MLAVFNRHGRERSELNPEAPLPAEVVWVDLLEPTAEEVALVNRMLGVELPTREEMREIEASARVYEEGEGLFMTVTLPIDADTPPPNTTEVTFILVGERLITLRYNDPRPFRSLTGRLDRIGPGLGNGLAVFFWLIDAAVGRLADIVERASLDIDQLSSRIFRAAKLTKGEERPDLLEAIQRIGRDGDTASKVRESLQTVQRVLLAISTTERLPAPPRKEVRQRAKALLRDVQPLGDQAGYLAQKCAFLLDATLGMINIEQNDIIKIFSIVAVVFLPPTLIASIYGMNFDLMPELHWAVGYPFAVLLMVISAVTPLLYFKRRGWL